MAALTGKQIAAKFAAINGFLLLSLLPFTTDLNLMSPSPQSALYFGVWAALSAFAYFRWRGEQMVTEVAGPLVIVFSLFSIATLFV
ncbi:MAG: hypothetical protein ABI422_03145 [Sphingomicrobium sp.]